MTIAIALLAVFVVALALVLARRKAAHGSAVKPDSAMAAGTPEDERTSPAAQPAVQVPELRPLLRRMYAAVMQAPQLAAPAALAADQVQVLEAACATLDRLDLQRQYLPRRPQLLPQLMRAVNDPDASGRAIAAIIAQDPALAANLLRIANSALYRTQGGEIDTLERAVVQVGTDGVRQLFATALMQPVLDLDGSVFARLPDAVWDFSLRCAAATCSHARRHGGDALSAQLLGLLHGLGAVVATRVLHDTYAGQHEVMPSLDVAAEMVDRRTAATARAVAIGWELAPALVEALDEQRPEHDARPPVTPLGTALRYGRLAAALAMLARAGAQDEQDALAQLATLEPDTQANTQLWTRLTAATAS